MFSFIAIWAVLHASNATEQQASICHITMVPSTVLHNGRLAILLLPSGFAEVQSAVLESEVVNCFDDDLRAGIRFWLFSCAA